ncbi:MAG: hypothetical protein ACJAZC_002399 [Cryomorphaceae bacterium]|jgi:hypothetical protein
MVCTALDVAMMDAPRQEIKNQKKGDHKPTKNGEGFRKF